MKIKSNHIVACLAAIFTMTLASCHEDWSDHYESTAESNGTLWQAISNHPELTQFSRVVKACNYDRVLDGSQAYTVFAPTDGMFTEKIADSLINDYQQQEAKQVRKNDNTVIHQFLQNHIALYKHPVSSLTNDSIEMMNSKYQVITNSMLGNRPFSSTNALCDNGLLFTVGQKIDYFPNVMEYLGHDNELDSVYAFLKAYNVYEFDEASSVPGEIVDGQTVYLDSVTTLHNVLLDKYGLINSEDSTYWLLCPTNTEWERLVNEYEPYFNYPNSVAKRDSLVYTSVRQAIIGGAFFSRNVNPDAAFQDSAVSTQAMSTQMKEWLGIQDTSYVYYQPFATGGIFEGTKDITCSNGHVLKANDFRISKFHTFAQTVKVEAENILSQDTILNAIDPLYVREVTANNPFYGQVSGNSYVEVVPNSPTAKVSVSFKIPNLLSSMKYDIYAVMVPATAYDTLAVEETMKPNIVRSVLRTTDQNGKVNQRRFNKNLYNDPAVVDTLLMASDIQIPTCSAGLSEALVKFEIASNVQSTQTATNSLTLRIDCILFKPHE